MPSQQYLGINLENEMSGNLVIDRDLKIFITKEFKSFRIPISGSVSVFPVMIRQCNPATDVIINTYFQNYKSMDNFFLFEWIDKFDLDVESK